MRHKVKKLKFGQGRDFVRSTMRKLVKNLIKQGRIKTTLAKAKSLKGFVDHLVFKAKKKEESTKNLLLKHLGEEATVKKLMEMIGPKFSDRESGFVRIKKLGPRLGDGAEMALVEWTKPIIEVKGKG